jgi:predicted Zn-dependent protease
MSPPGKKRRAPSTYSKEELLAMLEKGEIGGGLTKEGLVALAQGKKTWAEVAGLTREELYGFAQAALRMQKIGKHDNARKIVEGLVAANPKDGYFHALLAAMHGRAGDEKKALAAYDKAIQLDPTNLEARVVRAEMLLKKGELQKALVDLSEAAKIDPEQKSVHAKRAVALARATTQALQAAVADYQKRSGGRPSPR